MTLRENKIYVLYRFLKYLIKKQKVKTNRIHNVAMFHYGRCGSTVLGSLLIQHEKIRWETELFEILKLFPGKIFEENYTKNYLKILKIRMGMFPEQIFGFETKIREEAHLGVDFLNLDLEDYLMFLSELNFNKFIVLKRKNYLKQMFSIAKGFETKKWHYEKSEERKLIKIEINYNNFRYGNSIKPLLEYFQSFDDYYLRVDSFLRKNNSDVLNLEYESDIELNPKLAYNKVCEYLNIEKHNPKITLKKDNIYKLSDQITNFLELERYLKGTKYEWMLYE